MIRTMRIKNSKQKAVLFCCFCFSLSSIRSGVGEVLELESRQRYLCRRKQYDGPHTISCTILLYRWVEDAQLVSGLNRTVEYSSPYRHLGLSAQILPADASSHLTARPGAHGYAPHARQAEVDDFLFYFPSKLQKVRRLIRTIDDAYPRVCFRYLGADFEIMTTHKNLEISRGGGGFYGSHNAPGAALQTNQTQATAQRE